MTGPERIEQFAIRSGLAPQSVEALRPHFPRWAHWLREQGVDQIPTSPWDPTADGRAVSLLSLLIRQGSAERDSSIEHDLRNLTGVRPWKV